MGVVAPVTGVLAATVPVVAGVVLEGAPPPPVVVGIAVAVAAVFLVSRTVDDPATAGRSGLEHAIAAGLGLGVLGVTLAQVSEGLVFGPIAVMRLLQVVVIAGLVALTGSAWRLPRRVLPLVAAVGVFDLAGNGLFLVAVQSGPLAIAAILGSLYPVVTVILATVLLGERLTRANIAGVALAGVGIALITSGSG
jgi:drug/metabolite transporter (DMT)-like permease